MDNLAGYGSSDDDVEEKEAFSALSSENPVTVILPVISRSASGPLSPVESAVDSTVGRHNWELTEAPKPPKRRKVQIAIPELPGDDSDSDDEIQVTQATNKSVKLLSMLPQPKTTKRKEQKILLPSVMIKPKAKPVPVVISEPVIDDTSKDEDSDKEEESGTKDFFSLEATEEPEESELVGDYGPARPVDMNEQYGSLQTEPNDNSEDITPTVHPSQLYNMANVDVGPSTSEKGKYTDEQAHDLIYKYDMQQWGMERPVEMPEIVDVSVDRQLGPNVRENLLKNITTGSKVDPTVRQDDKKPDPLSKRKHQITYLAHMAKESEERLKDEWAQNRNNKRLASQKYGF